MTDLPTRIEAAEEGSFDLDKEILRALGYTWRGMAYWYRDDTHTWKGSVALTRSIDAALSLVPEGYHWSLTEHADGAGCMVHHELEQPDFNGEVTAATPALALCAAALRARLETKEL